MVTNGEYYADLQLKRECGAERNTKYTVGESRNTRKLNNVAVKECAEGEALFDKISH